MTDSLLRALEPKLVWDHFLELKNTPRPSKHEQAIMDHLLVWAQQRGLASRRDAVGNLCVKVPATPGCEGAPTVVLQNHVDIVVANADNAPENADAAQGRIPVERGEFDAEGQFTASDDGNWLRAPYTTLGADNGIGCAYALAVADMEGLRHPPLELLFTVDEEEGMSGALQLDAEALDMQGRILLNLDTEEDDVLTIGSAGGCDSRLRWQAEPEDATGWTTHQLALTDLQGGHSGLQINAGRANAIRVLATAIARAADQVPLRIVAINGGDRRNAIPRSCRATVATAPADTEALRASIAASVELLNRQFAGRDRTVRIAIEPAEPARNAFSVADSGRLTSLLLTIPAGVFAVTPEIPDLPETSNNLALVSTNGPAVEIGCNSRSSYEPGIKDVQATLRAAGRLAGAEVDIADGYPGWKPDLKSPLLAVARRTYENLFGQAPHVLAVHAGLECGVLTNCIAGLDCVSFGPTIAGNHAPGEHVSIASVDKCFRWLTQLLEELAAGSGGRTEE